MLYLQVPSLIPIKDSSNIAIEFDDEDEDYSIEEDLRLLEEEDRLHN